MGEGAPKVQARTMKDEGMSAGESIEEREGGNACIIFVVVAIDEQQQPRMRQTRFLSPKILHSRVQ